MADSWMCLMVHKGPGVLTDDVRNALKKAACRLSLENLDSLRFREAGCEGLIESSWTSHIVGAHAGILFRSTLDAEAGTYYVNFLMNTKDLKRGEEILRWYEEGGAPIRWKRSPGGFPISELYDFHDLSIPRLN